ncbi:MAG: RsmD family RNA methyltransferase [Acidimicrobiales bacterium]
MRVIAGEMRGRHIAAPPGLATRPTSDRAREALFSALESLGALEGAYVWDLFAGSGALGIEALSRGAAHATLIEHSPQAIAVVRANLAALSYGEDRATAVMADASGWVHDQLRLSPRRTVDLVLADPPYAWQGWGALLGDLAGLARLAVLQTGRQLYLPPQWHVLRSKRYGTTVVTLAQPNQRKAR